MTLLLLLFLVGLLAALAPVRGVDSRDLGLVDARRRDKLWSRRS